MKLEFFFVAIWTFLTLQNANGQQRIRNNGVRDRFQGGSTRSRGGNRPSSTAGQTELLGGESGFDPSLTSLVGWYPFGGVFGGGEFGGGGGGVIPTNIQNRNEVWGRGREFDGAQIAGSGNFDSGFERRFRQIDNAVDSSFARRFRQSDNTVDSGFEARFRQTDNEQGLPRASDFRRSGDSFADSGSYHNHKKNDDYKTKYLSDYKKEHGYDQPTGYEKKDYGEYPHKKKEYDLQKEKYDYKENGGNGYGRGNNRKEYDYKRTGEDGYNNFYRGNSGYHDKEYSNYNKGHNNKRYYSKEYENYNAYHGYDKKVYSGSGYDGYSGDRRGRDRHGVNDGFYQDRNGYNRHHRSHDSRGPEYDGYRENRYDNHVDSRRGRYHYHDDRQQKDNSGYYRNQYDSYRQVPRYYRSGAKTYDDHGYERTYDNYDSNNYRFNGQYLYGIFRDRSHGFRHGPNSGRGYYDNKKTYVNYQ